MGQFFKKDLSEDKARENLIGKYYFKATNMNPKFFCLRVILGLTAGLGLGCGTHLKTQEVKPGVAVNKIYLTVPDSLEKSAWMETFLWTVKCEATKGQICEGSPTLLIPPDKTLCRYDYKIVEGPEGNTEQVILVENGSSLKVNIRAVGGPDWNPYKSKIVLQVRAVGIAKKVDQETRKVLNCKPRSFSSL